VVRPFREAVSEGAGGLKPHSKPGFLGEHTKVGSICFLPLCVLLAKLSWKRNYGLKAFRNSKELWAKSLGKGMRNY
jgi:hypothetical protein